MEKPKFSKAFLVAMADLLGAARLMFWERGGDLQDGDPSIRIALEEAATALKALGIDTGTIESFNANLEDLLKSDMTIDQYKAMAGKPAPGKPI